MKGKLIAKIEKDSPGGFNEVMVITNNEGKEILRTGSFHPQGVTWDTLYLDNGHLSKIDIMKYHDNIYVKFNDISHLLDLKQ